MHHQQSFVSPDQSFGAAFGQNPVIELALELSMQLQLQLFCELLLQ